jgi:hypothetical protein
VSLPLTVAPNPPPQPEEGALLSTGRMAYGLTGPLTYSACSDCPITPPMMPPMGATQDSYSDCIASAPPNNAEAVKRAGLSEALETGIATR